MKHKYGTPPNTNTALPMLPPFLAPFLAEARRRRFGAMMRKNPQLCAAERDGKQLIMTTPHHGIYRLTKEISN